MGIFSRQPPPQTNPGAGLGKLLEQRDQRIEELDKERLPVIEDVRFEEISKQISQIINDLKASHYLIEDYPTLDETFNLQLDRIAPSDLLERSAKIQAARRVVSEFVRPANITLEFVTEPSVANFDSAIMSAAIKVTIDRIPNLADSDL